jgi:hypothetical protein
MTDDAEQSDRIYKGFAGNRRTNSRTNNDRVFKGLPRIRWAEDADEPAELAVAKDSAYYWWWVFLKESREYRRALSGRNDEPYAKMASDFGRLGDDFNYWWLKTGRKIFAEKLALPRVRPLEHGVRVNLDQINEKLVLEIPLTIRRSTILKQINRELDKVHQGAGLRVYKHGTAERTLYPLSRMRMPTLELLHRVWMARKENPNEEWHTTGERLNLSPVFIPTARDIIDEIKYKNRCMAVVIQRYHRKAAALIDFAARGDFPRIK